ncbi:hypothetical protein ABC304_09960 [Microbacterium sp. 1P10UB]|uniref:hypothetical protein n=1 Tax=unclassified Microbacterium TaxID=2609290 RepID=UPI0039A2DE92
MPKLAIEQVDAEMIDAGDGVHIPRTWGAVVTGLPEIPGAIRARIVYDQTLRRAVAQSVQVDRSGVGDEVTTTLLRDIRVQVMVKWAAMRVVRIARDGGDPESYGDYIRRLRAEEGRSEEQNLHEAVTLYRLASVINDGPLKLVSEELGVSVSTATRMMNRARVAGLVDEETGREGGLTPDLGHADSSTMLGKRESEGWQGRTTRTSSGSVRWICTSPRRARR